MEDEKVTDEPNYDSKTMQAKMADDPIASPTKDQITGNTVMQKIRSLIDNYLGWSKEITDKVNNLEPGGGGGKSYTAGDGINISDDDVISNADHTQTQTNTSDIASIRVSMSDMASSAALGAETEARKSADSTLQVNIDKKQDKLSTAQQSALDSGITATKVAKYDAYDTVKQNALNTTQMDAVNSGITAIKVSTYDKNSTDIAQLKISDSEHTDAISDISTQIDAQATEITAIKTKNASQDSDISALKTKTTNQDTEIQGLSESVVSDLTGTFTDSTRTLKLSLERESAPSIDCSVVIPGGGGTTLPENGYYWELINGDKWPRNWTENDIVMIKIPYKTSIDAYSWTTDIIDVDSSQGSFTLISKIGNDNYVINNLYSGGIGGAQITLYEPQDWNNASPSTPVIFWSSFAFNGEGMKSGTYESLYYTELLSTGFYRLRKFSS